MSEPLQKNGKTYLPIEKGCLLPPELMADAVWGQKTKPTKIYYAVRGEDITQSSGERSLVRANGDEVVFDNGFIPTAWNNRGEVTAARRDFFIPMDNGNMIGAEIRDRDYRLITKGTEVIKTPGFNGGEEEIRDYGFYLPQPNPKVVVKLKQPAYIPNAFGPGDHQWLDEPVLRLQEDGQNTWRVTSGINGPEYKETWTTLASFVAIGANEAKLQAQMALKASEKSFRLRHMWYIAKSIPLKFFSGRWISYPERNPYVKIYKSNDKVP